MSAERMPQTESSVLARPLGWITRLVVRFPVPVLAVAAALVVLSLALTVDRLGFRTSRLDLLNKKSDFNRLWIEYINEFGDADDTVVVVEGTDRQQVVPVLEELSTLLAQQNGRFHAVLHEVDLSKIRSKGLHYLPPEELQATERFLDRVEPIIRGQWARLSLGQMVGRLNHDLTASDGFTDPTVPSPDPAIQAGRMAELGYLSDGLLAALTRPDEYRSPWPEMPQSVATISDLGSQYLLTDNGRLGFVLLRLAPEESQGFARGNDSIDALRRLIDRVKAEHPEITIGLTGLPVMENDEMRSSQVSMAQASLLSLVGVACLFIAGFGGIRHPVLTVIALLVGIAWSLGYLTLAIGHLNILSVSFGVILIGLGIDFGVHYAARYLQLRATIPSSGVALEQTARCVGPGIVTGAITTAIAFFMAGFTEFTGVAELGLIAGGGILLCCLAAVVVLPALIHLYDSARPDYSPPVPLDVVGCMGPLTTRPRLVLVLTLAGTAVMTLGIFGFAPLGIRGLTYDHNLLNLQPVGVESVALERKLLAESDQSMWFAVSMADTREELLRRKQQFEQLPSVERVEDIASRFPTGNQPRAAIVRRVHRRLADLPERPPLIPLDRPEELGRVLAQAQTLAGRRSGGLKTQRRLELIRDALRRMPLASCYQRLSDYQQQMAGDLVSRLHQLQAMSNPEPPQLTDLPEGLVTRFVGQRGRHLLKIYSRADIWDMEAMKQFVAEVRSVDPRATGNPLQTYEASIQMKQSYEQAAWYALAAIVVVLLIDFRRMEYVLLAMVPLGFGMLQLFGVLGVLGISLNPANMIVLPLILGIGIDDGVHVVHDFRCQQGPYRMSPSTACAVLITSLTTMVGFGSLMIADHRGLQSLGRVLTIGVSCCLFSSLVILPALMNLLRRGSRDPVEPVVGTSATTPAPHFHHRAPGGRLSQTPERSPRVR